MVHADEVVEANIISRRPYADVIIGDLPKQRALIDSGSEISCNNARLIMGMEIPVETRIRISGLKGKADQVDVVKLHVRFPLSEGQVTIGPPVRVCMVCCRSWPQ